MPRAFLIRIPPDQPVQAFAVRVARALSEFNLFLHSRGESGVTMRLVQLGAGDAQGNGESAHALKVQADLDDQRAYAALSGALHGMGKQIDIPPYATLSQLIEDVGFCDQTFDNALATATQLYKSLTQSAPKLLTLTSVEGISKEFGRLHQAHPSELSTFYESVKQFVDAMHLVTTIGIRDYNMPDMAVRRSLLAHARWATKEDTVHGVLAKSNREGYRWLWTAPTWKKRNTTTSPYAFQIGHWLVSFSGANEAKTKYVPVLTAVLKAATRLASAVDPSVFPGYPLCFQGSMMAQKHTNDSLLAFYIRASDDVVVNTTHLDSIYKPNEADDKLKPPAYYHLVMVLLHEYAHRYWFKVMDAATRAAWVAAYNKAKSTGQYVLGLGQNNPNPNPEGPEIYAFRKARAFLTHYGYRYPMVEGFRSEHLELTYNPGHKLADVDVDVAYKGKSFHLKGTIFKGHAFNLHRFPTGYASTNAVEFFAEYVMLYASNMLTDDERLFVEYLMLGTPKLPWPQSLSEK